MARESRRPALDQPYEPRRRVRPVRPEVDPERLGRLSERVARFIGSWRFIGYMTAFLIVWFAWNTLGPKELRFDPYAFLFMTLLLSLQASYAAPLILLAQNRQTDRDRVQYQQDRNRDERSVTDTEYLVREIAALRIALGDLATRDFVRSKLRDLLEELAEPGHAEDNADPSSATKRAPTTTG